MAKSRTVIAGHVILCLGTLALALFFSFLAWWGWQQREQQWQQQLDMHSELQRLAVLQARAGLERQALLAANQVSENPDLLRLVRRIAVLAKRDGLDSDGVVLLRAQLQADLQGVWTVLTASGANQLHIHLAPGVISLLRMHRPEAWGDQLDDIRHLVDQVQRTGQPAQGLEVGRHGSGIRGIVPIRAGPEYDSPVIASVEVGYGMLPELRQLDLELGAGLALMLHQPSLDGVMLEMDQHDLARFGQGEWLLDQYSRREILDWRNTGQLPQPSQGSGYQLLKAADRDYLLTLIPLQDALERPLAAVLAWREISIELLRHADEQKQLLGRWLIALLAATGLFTTLLLASRATVRRQAEQHQQAIIQESLAREQARQGLERQRQALRALNEIASLQHLGQHERLRRVLELGCGYLRLDMGIVSRIKDDDYQVLSHHAKDDGLEDGTHFPLGQTYCSLTLAQDDVLAIDNMGQSAHCGHPCYQQFGLETYIGIPLMVAGERFGTLNFSSAAARNQPFEDTDLEFMRLCGRWIAAVLTRGKFEQEREALLSRFSKLARHLPGMVYQYQYNCSGRGWFPYSSQGIVDIYGITPEQAAASDMAAFEAIYPEDRQRVAISIRESAAGLSEWRCEYRIHHPQRGLIWVAGRSSPEPLENGDIIWHGVITDISEQVRATRALQKSESRFRSMVSNLPGVVYRCRSDADWTMSYMSDGIARLTGYPASDFIDNRVRSYASIVHPDDLHLTYATIVHIERRESFELTYRIVHADGHHVWVREKGRGEYDSQDQLLWLDGFIWDITEQHRVEQLKTQFVSAVSHELRTPLTAIAGALGLVLGGAMGEVPEPMAKLLGIARQNSDNLHALINDLLDMDKLSEGKMHFELECQRLKPLLEQALSLNQGYAEQYQVRLLAGRIDDAWVTVDAKRFGQVLANYLSNAAKFSHPGGDVVLEACIEAGQVTVSVTDRGIGIPADFQEQIFQKFSQADGSDTRQRGGTGLGLAISRELAQRMGGEVGFESQEGQGSCFWFRLPVSEVSSVPAHHSGEPS